MIPRAPPNPAPDECLSHASSIGEAPINATEGIVLGLRKSRLSNNYIRSPSCPIFMYWACSRLL